MKLFKVERTDSWGYDDYDSFICAANSVEEARYMTPDPWYTWKPDGWHFKYSDGTSKLETGKYSSGWITNPTTVSVVELDPSAFANPEIVLASYNPG